MMFEMHPVNEKNNLPAFSREKVIFNSMGSLINNGKNGVSN